MIEAILMGGLNVGIESIQNIISDVNDSTAFSYDIPSPVDPSRSIVIFSQASVASTNTSIATCEILDESTVLFSKISSNSTPISISVIEFSPGVFVQRGNASYPSGQDSFDVSIDEIDLENSFVLCSFRGNVPIDQLMTRCSIVDSTTINFYRADGTGSVDIHWQVFSKNL